MPKYRIQWKDPDRYIERIDGAGDVAEIRDYDELGDDYAKLRQLGHAEYLVVEFDTDAMTATVKRPK
jgi:hypothetical protein